MSQVSQLRKENHQIVTGINITTQRFLSVEAANSILRVQISELSNRLESLNEIIGFLSSNNGVLNPWNMAYLNQPIMASAEIFHC
ncbi:bZIP transcription factor 44-like [Populus alba x Populus x berolinensis]|uniref:BZIP transcription factor 44-like n=1 Tax=Populus alba x Populus x berolinensis TaxID=444605 RepID=A0AAD6R444_9ROSI|nr:bZIP transcription factor 44-like [Populus alba x Populus x berolinensis]